VTAVRTFASPVARTRSHWSIASVCRGERVPRIDCGRSSRWITQAASRVAVLAAATRTRWVKAMSSYHPGSNRMPELIRRSRRITRPAIGMTAGFQIDTLRFQRSRASPASSTSGVLARSSASTAASAPGTSRSSPSTNQTYVPVARSSPALRAGPGPAFVSRWITVSRGSRAARSSSTWPL
jgi:hypothetical protein